MPQHGVGSSAGESEDDGEDAVWLGITLVGFHHCCKILEEINLQQRKDWFGSIFRHFNYSALFLWGLGVNQNTMARMCHRVSYSPPNIQGGGEGRDEDRCPTVPTKGTTLTIQDVPQSSMS